MARPIRFDFKGAFHHIMVRGVNKINIFKTAEDMRYIIRCIAKTIGELDGAVSAFCIMHNHLHILYESDTVGISRFMQRLLTKYAYYYKKEYGHIGHVYQGRFKSILVQPGGEKYFLAAIRYILRNPLEGGLTKDLFEYEYSSINSYFAPRQYAFVNTNLVEAYFGNIEKFSEFILKSQEIALTGYRVKDLVLFGDKAFAERTIKLAQRGQRIENREFQQRVLLSDIEKYIKDKFSVDIDILKREKRFHEYMLPKKISIYLLSRRAHLKYSEIAGLLEISEVTVYRHILDVEEKDKLQAYIADFDAKLKAKV